VAFFWRFVACVLRLLPLKFTLEMNGSLLPEALRQTVTLSTEFYNQLMSITNDCHENLVREGTAEVDSVANGTRRMNLSDNNCAHTVM